VLVSAFKIETGAVGGAANNDAAPDFALSEVFLAVRGVTRVDVLMLLFEVSLELSDVVSNQL